jgi:uncharacterized protein YutE (UPF0331/DUF86 family)
MSTSPIMTNDTIVANKLVRIETLLQEFVQHTLQLAIQAAINIAAHIVADDRLGEPHNHVSMFQLLADHGWLPQNHVGALRRLAGFRDVLVYGYDDVDAAGVIDIVKHHLQDLDAFVAAVRMRMSSAGG